MSADSASPPASPAPGGQGDQGSQGGQGSPNRLKAWLRMFQVAIILAVGGVLLFSGVAGVRAGMLRGEPVSIPEERERIAAAERLLASDAGADDAARDRAAAEIRAAGERIFREERRQDALSKRGRAIALIVVGALGYAVLIFEFARIVVLVRRSRREE